MLKQMLRFLQHQLKLVYKLSQEFLQNYLNSSTCVQNCKVGEIQSNKCQTVRCIKYDFQQYCFKFSLNLCFNSKILLDSTEQHDQLAECKSGQIFNLVSQQCLPCSSICQECFRTSYNSFISCPKNFYKSYLNSSTCVQNCEVGEIQSINARLQDVLNMILNNTASSLVLIYASIAKYFQILLNNMINQLYLNNQVLELNVKVAKYLIQFRNSVYHAQASAKNVLALVITHLQVVLRISIKVIQILLHAFKIAKLEKYKVLMLDCKMYQI
ncbi:hypothetical protein TTHERM_00812630 (macronuclear) [Tetrahymena thermophila SB210]|uniref:Uncharacterized protein n=1 Tax=Tetrahymena thermophila (strain SB210) TaxID=312017 RepID=Q22SW8_TETTS|nr:hypothetical protein TTHERM_00812630 [Tetrahymena thermophila SB210]EAR88346.2 hypothetical protein TTHERM_00812630 [Tetrahymena thermophila SB210]|eukprot:XP_001008591.2 hypothetical protein TTHERM_00812630 [Tetrahymena thermophila SB210]